MHDDKGPLVTRYEAAKMLKMSAQTLDRRRKAPDFPKAVKNGPRFVHFFEQDILEYRRKCQK